jgi:hypothetical protein
MVSPIFDGRTFAQAVTIGYHDDARSLWQKFIASVQPACYSLSYLYSLSSLSYPSGCHALFTCRKCRRPVIKLMKN